MAPDFEYFYSSGQSSQQKVIGLISFACGFLT